MLAHLKKKNLPSSGWLSPTLAWACTSTTSPAWGRSQRLWWRWGATSPPTGRRRKSLLVSSAGFHCPLFLVSLWVSYLLIVVLWHLEQVAYNLGLGSLTWVVATEVLPIRLEFQKTERQSKTWFQGPAVGLTPWPTSPPTSAGSSSPRRSGTCRTRSATPPPSFCTAEFVSSGSSSSSSSFRRPGQRLPRKPLSLSLVSNHFLIGSVHKVSTRQRFLHTGVLPSSYVWVFSFLSVWVCFFYILSHHLVRSTVLNLLLFCWSLPETVEHAQVRQNFFTNLTNNNIKRCLVLVYEDMSKLINHVIDINSRHGPLFKAINIDHEIMLRYFSQILLSWRISN